MRHQTRFERTRTFALLPSLVLLLSGCNSLPHAASSDNHEPYRTKVSANVPSTEPREGELFANLQHPLSSQSSWFKKIGSKYRGFTQKPMATKAKRLGDLNGDNLVDEADMEFLHAAWWVMSDGNADVTGDDRIGDEDIKVIMENWGPCSGQSIRSAPNTLGSTKERSAAYEQVCKGDINGDHVVDDLDLQLVSWGYWVQGGGRADLNEDGATDGQDLVVLIAHMDVIPEGAQKEQQSENLQQKGALLPSSSTYLQTLEASSKRPDVHKNFERIQDLIKNNDAAGVYAQMKSDVMEIVQGWLHEHPATSAPSIQSYDPDSLLIHEGDEAQILTLHGTGLNAINQVAVQLSSSQEIEDGEAEVSIINPNTVTGNNLSSAPFISVELLEQSNAELRVRVRALENAASGIYKLVMTTADTSLGSGPQRPEEQLPIGEMIDLIRSWSIDDELPFKPETRDLVDNRTKETISLQKDQISKETVSTLAVHPLNVEQPKSLTRVASPLGDSPRVFQKFRGGPGGLDIDALEPGFGPSAHKIEIPANIRVTPPLVAFYDVWREGEGSFTTNHVMSVGQPFLAKGTHIQEVKLDIRGEGEIRVFIGPRQNSSWYPPSARPWGEPVYHYRLARANLSSTSAAHATFDPPVEVEPGETYYLEVLPSGEEESDANELEVRGSDRVYDYPWTAAYFSF